MKRLLVNMLVSVALAGSVMAGTFSSGLERLVAGKPDNESITVLLAMQDQADIASLDQDLHARQATLAERHELVVGKLMSTSTRSQANLLTQLSDLKAAGKVNGFTPYWLVNAVVVNAPISVLRTLAARSDVDVVEPNLVAEMIQPLMPNKPVDRNPLTNDRVAEAGVIAVRAPEVWSTLGITGVGALVGGIDTGVDYTHSTLSSRWRGNNGHPVGECWLDAAGLGHATPTDTHGHGTHTMGTMVGGAPGLEVGVAPGSQWIASNIINSGTGPAFDNGVIASFQFMADPDGNPGTIDDVPDVVQNSWGVNEGFSGYFDCDSRWWVAIDNCEAAGVCVTWSAGNEGPGGTSLRSPADRALTPYNCFSVGATSAYFPYDIASFSSRGPSGCGGAFAMKPEISAPGVDTYSAYPGGGYTTMSGTSMAGPHVAGVVALMRSANPNVDVNTIKQILMDTGIDMGAVGEDNTYGHGFIDAYEAVLAVMSGYGTLAGTVTNSSNGNPIAGVLVDNIAGPQQANTNGLGVYSMMMPAGAYSISYSAFGFTAQTVGVTITEDLTTTQNIALSPAPSALLYGYVYGPDSNPVVGATIDFTNAPVADVTSGAGGYYSVTIPTGYTYDMTASAAGVGSQSQTLTFNSTGQLDFNLPINPMYLPTGPDAYGYRIFDSNDAGGVGYEWTDISGTGSALTLSDDSYQTVSVPFSFNYYGATFNQLSVGSNGYVTCGATGNSSYTNGPLPGLSNTVHGMWDDLNPSSGGTVYYQHIPAQGRFIVQWHNVSYYGGGGSVLFQIVLLDPATYPSESGDAQWIMNYTNGERLSHTTGLTGATGANYLQYEYNGSYDVNASPLSGPIALLFSSNTNGIDPGDDTTPPAIVHTPLSSTQNTAGPYVVTAAITDYSGVASATLRYRVNAGAWTSVAMSPGYTANIPGPRPIGNVIDYYIMAVDASENANAGQTPTYTFSILAPTGLEYCQDFETGTLDDFTVETYAPGNSWITSSYSGQGYTAYIVFSSPSQQDHSALISPVFDCSGQATVDFSFWMNLHYGYSSYWTDAYVRGSTDGGATWPIMIAEWHATPADPDVYVTGNFAYDISSWAAGQSNVKVMFEYHALYDWDWYVDDICLTGTLNVGPSPVDLNIAYLGGGTAQLSWTAVPNATSYDVYVANEMDEPYTFVANTIGTTYAMAASGNTTKCYQVVTRNDAVAASRAVHENPLPRLATEAELLITK